MALEAVRHCSQFQPFTHSLAHGVIKREESVLWLAPFYVLSLPRSEKVDWVIALYFSPMVKSDSK